MQTQYCLFGSILLGLPCIMYLFGPTEREVALWGVVSLLAGLSSMQFSGREMALKAVTYKE